MSDEKVYFEDRLRESWKKFRHWVDNLLDGHISEDDREWDAFLDRLVAVREGKAPKYDGEWIPCEYRQPPKPGTYLTTTRKGAVRMNHWHGKTWGYQGDAIAWRPLPEAYRHE